MHEKIPGAAVYVGQEAITRFSAYLNSYLQDDATGNSYLVHRDDRTDLRMIGMTMCSIELIVQAISNADRIGELGQYEMIVVDSGNRHGDSWIATFYPKQCVTTFVDQIALQEKTFRQCSSCGGSEDAGFRGGQCSACAGHSEDNAVLPTQKEVQRNQMECMLPRTGLPALERRHNNASLKSICPLCKESFKPSIGDWDFLAGTIDPVCESCSTEIEQKLSEASSLDEECPF